MKRLVALMMICMAVSVLYAQENDQSSSGQGLAVANEIQNKGAEKQIRVMEQTLAKEGVDQEAVKTARRTCLQMCNEGYTPEECTQSMTQTMLQFKKEGLKGKELGDKARERVRERLKVKIQEKKELKTQTRERIQARTQLSSEIRERIRESRPEDKGGTGTATQQKGRK